MTEVGSTARTLDATNNRITDIPDTVLQLTTLQRLLLANNSIMTVPQSLCMSLTALKVLVLDNNTIASLPDAIGSMTRLERLSIASNVLAVLPDSIGKLHALKELDVPGNKLKACVGGDVFFVCVCVCVKHTFVHTSCVIPAWGAVCMLNNIENRPFSPPSHLNQKALPDTLSTCTLLHSINASDNYITSIPSSLGQLTNLNTLSLDSNRIGAVPPVVLQGCVRLQTLSLHNNLITIEELEATEGYASFDARRRGKFDKKIAGGLAIGPGGLDEGIDRRR